MSVRRFALLVLFGACACVPAEAVEGPAAAGPIGGTDVRSALPPPPGLYGGAAFVAAQTRGFFDGEGRRIPALRDATLLKGVGGPFLVYVPERRVAGGTIAFSGFLPFVSQCGRLFAGQKTGCKTALGDPYVEADWSRFFGALRPSKYPGAYPIPEGLAVMLGLGGVIPIGQFTKRDPLSQSLSAGTGIWDVSPSIAVTYTTSPIIAEGTEFTAKLFWNNYFTNSKTRYRTGDLINLDFAVTEHFGRFQFGPTGFYAKQVEDDTIRGRSFAKDGARGELLQLGGVLVCDLPEFASSVKFKALTSAHAENTVKSWSVVTAWITKF